MSGLLQSGSARDTSTLQPLVREATLGEVWDANRVLARSDRSDGQAELTRRSYEPVLASVNADRARRGLDPLENPGLWVGDLERRPSTVHWGLGGLTESRVNRTQQEATIFREISDIRRRDPKFLSGVAITADEFRRGFTDRERMARAAARNTVARGEGLGATLTGFAAGVFETMHDPVNILSLPLGGGGKTILSQVARSALVNGALEAVQQPIVAENRAALGEDLSAGEAAANVAMAAVGGVIGDVVLPAAGKAAVRGVAAAVPTDVKAGLALRLARLPDASDGDVAAAFSRSVPREIRTPDEMAALNVIDREAEVRAASPFVSTPAALDAHADRLASAMEAILRANTEPASVKAGLMGSSAGVTRAAARPVVRGGGLASDIVEFFRGKGYSDAEAQGIAAGVAAEAASNHAAVNPASGAMGLGQWLGSRKAELIRRYGPRPTREQQLEFLHWELQGGDHGGRAVRGHADPAQVLDAYIRRFMRPAAGAETNGDLARGMAALGRGGEDVMPAPDAAAAVDGVPSRPAAMDAERVAIDGPELVAQDGPLLAREGFPDETSWRVAQAAEDAGMVGGAPAVTRQSVWIDARDRLLAQQGGVAEGALFHPDVGPIDVVWGNSRSGLQKIAQKHPEVMDDLPALIASMGIESATDNRIVLRSLDHKAVVRLDLDGKAQKWLLTAYQYNGRKRKASPGTEDWGAPGSARDPSPIAQGRTDIASPAGNFQPEAAVRTGDFYELHGDVAARAAKALDMVVTRGRDGRPLLGLPAHAAERYAADLADAGIDVELVDPRAPIRAVDNPVPSAGDDPRVLDVFDAPDGEGARAQVDSLAHDARAALDASGQAGEQLGFRFDDGGEDAGLADVLADLDADDAAIAAIKDCL